MSDIVKVKILSIIVSYNGAAWLTECLRTLQNSDYRTDIFVVDNHSSDTSQNIIADLLVEDQYIFLQQNLGFGQANNIGLKQAIEKKYDYVFLLNQDTRIEKDCLEKLVAAHLKDSSFALISPWHYDYVGNGNEIYFNDYVLNQYTDDVQTKRELNDQNKIYNSSFVHAAAWFLPLKTLQDVGGFDPLFFYTGEDNDYVQRMHFKSKKIGILSSAIIMHKGSNTGLVDPELNKAHFRNTTLLKLKYPTSSLAGAFCLFAKNAIGIFYAKTFSKTSVKTRMEAKVYSDIFLQLSTIIKSRAEQKKRQAYLN